MKIYGDVNSGNCYKVKLVAEQVKCAYEWIAVDILNGETKTPAFTTLNPAGKIPVLITNEGDLLAESNAIIWYLAKGTKLLPDDHFDQAKILQWLFFEQYMHEPYIATARFIQRYLGNPESRQEELQAKRKKGYEAIAVMEGHLSCHDFFVGDAYSIADVALFAYTHVAEEGGFSLTDTPHIRRWIDQVSKQEAFIKLG